MVKITEESIYSDPEQSLDFREFYLATKVFMDAAWYIQRTCEIAKILAEVYPEGRKHSDLGEGLESEACLLCPEAIRIGGPALEIIRSAIEKHRADDTPMDSDEDIEKLSACIVRELTKWEGSTP